MDYAFNLDFNELDEDLQETKIDEYIEHGYENGDIEKLDEVEKFSLEDALDDQDIRKDARKSIEARFPMYF